MTDTTDDAPAEGDVVQTPTEPTPVDNTTAPDVVLRALGFDPEAVQAVILTPTSVVAVAADYPDPPEATGYPETDGSQPVVPDEPEGVADTSA
ncbi:hypothetical protein GCM10025864_39710 [Luteimicrobium album]|uniref:Uncharacterized protein n=1 Tax=Luteimicrobium album TaxID=1054550 RepID=A0ABQ6I6Z7_9MICO|nr:hypothetical protein [Luteimicrobium album]GMA26212.1 hypothetical protein GCM10025864_39710 [Luteimicrobium album]